MNADQWNALHPVGTPVVAYPVARDGQGLTTVTRTPAWTLGHGQPVVSVEGYAGGIALDHVDVAPRTTSEAIDTPLLENEEKDTPASGQPAGAASTARAEILRALQAYGHSDASALVVLRRADCEPRDPDPDPDFRETLGGGHALVVEYGDCEMHASCQCGTRLGMTTPDASLDTFVPAWEHHTNTEAS